MDKLDYKILRILKENGREKASNISREIHLSVSSVIDRIRHMEESGVIQGYTAIIDETALGNELTALIEVRLEHPKFADDFIASMNENPYIVSCYYLTGEFDYIVKICCQSPKQLEQLHQKIKEHKGVNNTRTHFVLKTTKNMMQSLPPEE